MKIAPRPFYSVRSTERAMGAITLTRDDDRAIQQASLDELHVRAAQLDPRDFAPLYETYFKPVYGYCARLLRDPQAAADATSETFVKALNGLPKYRARSFRGWLFTIAHHVVIDMTRRHKPTTALDDASELTAGDSSPEEWYLTRESDRRVARLLRRLPGNQRQIVELRIAGLRSQEIADVLGISIGAVRTAQYRAHTRLRELLNDPRADLEFSYDDL
jgi:RNA polymerase sigma-70 factor (ECF subfamily)